MKKLGWQEVEFGMRRKGHAGKLKMARRLRRETPMSLKWIADRLKMATWTNVTKRLYHSEK
jgi:hypothetical protein